MANQGPGQGDTPQGPSGATGAGARPAATSPGPDRLGGADYAGRIFRIAARSRARSDSRQSV